MLPVLAACVVMLSVLAVSSLAVVVVAGPVAGCVAGCVARDVVWSGGSCVVMLPVPSLAVAIVAGTVAGAVAGAVAGTVVASFAGSVAEDDGRSARDA